MEQTEGYYLVNFARGSKIPWKITLTNETQTATIKVWEATDFEINTPSKSFAGSQYHFIICKGVLFWEGTKAVINAPTTFQHLPLV